MDEQKLLELSRRTLRILNQLIQETNLINVPPERECHIIGQLGPVILDALIEAELGEEEWEEED